MIESSSFSQGIPSSTINQNQCQSKDSFSVRFQSKYDRFKGIGKMLRAQGVKNYILKPKTHYLES